MDRTDRILKILIRVVIVPGLFAASYLTYSKLSHTEPLCGANFDCGAVNSSRWSEVGGIPVTILGIIAYVLMFASTFVRADWGKMAGAFLAVVGAAFSIFLQYEALIVLEKTCPYCLTSAAAMITLAVLTSWRMFRLPDAGSGDSVGDDDPAAVSA